jgi:hypothetical protein
MLPVPLMPVIARVFATLAVALSLSGCSLSVPVDEVYGTYIASYPFGTETLTLNRDGTFVQKVVVEHQGFAGAQGKWEFDASESLVTFYGALVVDDGRDHVRPDWRVPPSGVAGFYVEKEWFTVVMASGLPHPYIKQ